MIKFILIGLFIFLIFSCNNNDNSGKIITNNDSAKISGLDNNIIIKINPNQELLLNRNIKISVIPKKTEEIDSIQVLVNDKKISTLTSGDSLVNWNSANAKTGNNKVVAIGYWKEKNIRNQITVILLSDIVPALKSYKIIKTYPHDKNAYTQGLFIHKGILYEATGLKGESSLRKTKIVSGDIIQSYAIPNDVFGEGITLFDNKIFQLSWTEQIAYIYDMETFEKTGEFEYYTEGWGLTNDGKNLIMSDGTNKLYFIETQSFSTIDQLEVYDDKGPVKLLNELEYIDGIIYANIYTTNQIVLIEAKSGKVLQKVDLTGLLSEKDKNADTDVLNGIAYDFDNKKLYVTGKKWSKLFEIQIIDK